MVYSLHTPLGLSNESFPPVFRVFNVWQILQGLIFVKIIFIELLKIPLKHNIAYSIHIEIYVTNVNLFFI